MSIERKRLLACVQVFSFVPFMYKINLIKMLLFRAYEICSNFQNFNNEIIFVKEM